MTSENGKQLRKMFAKTERKTAVGNTFGKCLRKMRVKWQNDKTGKAHDV